MAQILIITCMIVGLIVGMWEMHYARKNPRDLFVPYEDPNQTGNSRTRRGMFDIFNGK